MYNNSNRPDSNYNTRLIEMSIVQNMAHAGTPAIQKLWIMFKVHNSSIYIYNTFIDMESGNSLFNMQRVKYFSGADRRPCPPLKYVTLLSM